MMKMVKMMKMAKNDENGPKNDIYTSIKEMYVHEIHLEKWPKIVEKWPTVTEIE